MRRAQGSGALAGRFLGSAGLTRRVMWGGSAACSVLVGAAQQAMAQYTPAQIQTAYGFSQLYNSSSHPLNGAGETIAIVDEGNDSTITSDFSFFNNYFTTSNGGSTTSLNQGSLTVVPETGYTLSQLSTPDLQQLEETSLDVEYAHAIAPAANIVLVETASYSFSDMDKAVQQAVNSENANVVSMSYGADEGSGENTLDNTYTQPSGRGVTYVASSGDTGNSSYPAASPVVLSVGGTSLTLNSSGKIVSETAWTGSGGGTSPIESAPTAQSTATGSSARETPDVAYNADPNTGVGEIYTYNGSLWEAQIGGTSAGAPQWAALVSLVDEGLTLNDGTATSLSTTQLLNELYAIYDTRGSSPLYSEVFNDITSGYNEDSDGNILEYAGTGYDEVTGLGSPIANNLVDYLAGYGVSVPEPASIVGLALAPLLVRRRRRAAVKSS